MRAPYQFRGLGDLRKARKNNKVREREKWGFEAERRGPSPGFGSKGGGRNLLRPKGN